MKEEIKKEVNEREEKRERNDENQKKEKSKCEKCQKICGIRPILFLTLSDWIFSQTKIKHKFL